MKKILFLLALFFPISVLAEDITSTSKITIDNNVSTKINDKNEINNEVKDREHHTDHIYC